MQSAKTLNENTLNEYKFDIKTAVKFREVEREREKRGGRGTRQ